MCVHLCVRVLWCDVCITMGVYHYGCVSLCACACTYICVCGVDRSSMYCVTYCVYTYQIGPLYHDDMTSWSIPAAIPSSVGQCCD